MPFEGIIQSVEHTAAPNVRRGGAGNKRKRRWKRERKRARSNGF
jgi:hypothetical protein